MSLESGVNCQLGDRKVRVLHIAQMEPSMPWVLGSVPALIFTDCGGGIAWSPPPHGEVFSQFRVSAPPKGRGRENKLNKHD
jgi:hypothetical protein